MAIKEILTDVELVGKGLPARENIQRINENFQELSGGGGETTPVDWNDIENKPAFGTAATTNSTAYATAAQGTKADTAVQPAALDAKLDKPSGGTNAQLIRGDGSTVAASTYATAANLTSGLAAKLDKPAGGTSAQLIRGDGTTVASNTFATSTQGTKADNAVPKTVITALDAGETDLATIVAKINEIIAALD
ncbi:hypothetical protein phiOC_p320 [Ochrobactrum phage vB_OspM_OC]|nr:hypothetical protein phiOC_p320 [Ochrobactrum phage vB_OspM_OC]